MSCVLLCCTPSSHALVLAAQAAAAPAEAPSPRARASRPDSQVPVSVPARCRAPARHRSPRDALPPAVRRVRSPA